MVQVVKSIEKKR